MNILDEGNPWRWCVASPLFVLILPVASGYRTNTTLIEVLGGNGVEPLHGDDPQQTSPGPLMRLMMLATTLVTPRTVHCEGTACSTLGNTGWGNLIEEFAPFPHVDWGGCRKQAALRCLGAEYAKHATSLNNLDVGNQVIGAIHYCVCAYMLFSMVEYANYSSMVC